VLSYTAANLKQANVTLFNEGVSDVNATCNVIVDGTSRGAKTERTALGRIRLTGIGTAIERIGGKLDLLKMDCEGGEWDILLNNAAFRTVREIRMEYHLGAHHEIGELKELARSLRFRITKIIPHGKDFGIAWLENFSLVY
jgi:hypothetical protein